MKPRSQPKPPAPVAADCRWLHTPVLPCSLAPQGLPGLVWVESQTERGPVADCYLVTANIERGQLMGWRFVNSSGKVYDIDDVHGACDCPDSQFRHRECKHVKAVQAMPSASLAPPPATLRFRSAAEMAEHPEYDPAA